MNEKEIIENESFGQICFSRVQGRGTNFYGSEIEQDHYIVMTLDKSYLERTLTTDRYITTGAPLVRVRLSSSQFAELITSLNIGSGVPCTIEYINGKKNTLPKQESRKEVVHRLFEERMIEFAEKLVEKQTKAKEIISGGKLTNSNKLELSEHIEWITREIRSNIPFFVKCFQETMDDIVQEGKAEFENAILHKAITLGFEQMLNNQKQIKDERT